RGSERVILCFSKPQHCGVYPLATASGSVSIADFSMQRMQEPYDQENQVTDNRRCERKDHYPDRFILKIKSKKPHFLPFSRTMFIIRSNTFSIGRPLESITIASSATTRGESARVVSRRSRSRMSAKVCS